jgi:hypothetical protein
MIPARREKPEARKWIAGFVVFQPSLGHSVIPEAFGFRASNFGLSINCRN